MSSRPPTYGTSVPLQPSPTHQHPLQPHFSGQQSSVPQPPTHASAPQISVQISVQQTPAQSPDVLERVLGASKRIARKLLGRLDTFDKGFNLLTLIIGIVFGVCALKYQAWTARKDYLEYCSDNLKDLVGKSLQDCQQAIKSGLPRPPLKSLEETTGPDRTDYSAIVPIQPRYPGATLISRRHLFNVWLLCLTITLMTIAICDLACGRARMKRRTRVTLQWRLRFPYLPVMASATLFGLYLFHELTTYHRNLRLHVKRSQALVEQSALACTPAYKTKGINPALCDYAVSYQAPSQDYYDDIYESIGRREVIVSVLAAFWVPSAAWVLHALIYRAF